MHDTAYEHGRLFFQVYWQPGFATVVDLGSQDVNGSLRDHCPPDVRYVGLDMAPGRGVDLVVEPGSPLPFADASVDVVVTSSAFEHDVAFWQTFAEMARVIRPGGLLYVNAPSNNDFHRYPLDCWRFYPDAGIALARWAASRGVAVDLVESFVAEPGQDGWADFVAVFRKPDDAAAPAAPAAPAAGRISDHAVAANVYRGSESQLDAEEPRTHEVRELARLREELATAQATAQAGASELASLRTRLREATAARKKADAALSKIRASTSWRVTAPIRQVSERVRRR